jgi:hypothetical protein
MYAVGSIWHIWFTLKIRNTGCSHFVFAGLLPCAHCHSASCHCISSSETLNVQRIKSTGAIRSSVRSPRLDRRREGRRVCRSYPALSYPQLWARSNPSRMYPVYTVPPTTPPTPLFPPNLLKSHKLHILRFASQAETKGLEQRRMAQNEVGATFLWQVPTGKYGTAADLRLKSFSTPNSVALA